MSCRLTLRTVGVGTLISCIGLHTGLFAQDAAPAQETGAELAKKLSNPVAFLINVPILNNWEFGIGPANAMRYTANLQPVIPFSLSKDWNLVTRTIIPVKWGAGPTGLALRQSHGWTYGLLFGLEIHDFGR